MTDLKRRGLVKVSVPLLETLFGNECRVERIVVTDEDILNNTITLVVTDHPTLPVASEGHRLQQVSCRMSKETASGRIRPRFFIDK